MVVIVRKKDGTVKRSDEKVCGKCERLLSYNHFYRRGKNGLQHWCKDCMKERGQKQKIRAKIETKESKKVEDEFNRQIREQLADKKEQLKITREARMSFLSAYVKIKEVDPEFVGKLSDIIGPNV